MRPRTLDEIGTPRFAELKHQILELIIEHENLGISQAVAAP